MNHCWYLQNLLPTSYDHAYDEYWLITEINGNGTSQSIFL